MAAAESDTYQCTLSEALKAKALEELNEKPEWRQRDIQALRDMVIAHKGLKCPTDDRYLLRFLRAKKFDYDRAYQQLINYYQIRGENSGLIGQVKPSTISACLDAGITCVLPKRDQDGMRIIYFRPGKWDPEKFSIYDILKLNLMTIELVIQEEETQINGLAMVGNMSGVGWKQAKAIERQYFKIMTSLLQGAFPCRFKGMHAINEPSVFSYIFTIVKPFLREKMRSRLNFYGSDIHALHRRFNPEILPAELGGKLEHGDKYAEEWSATLRSKEAYFESLQQYSIQLDKTLSSHRADDNVECLIGTYRKLDVD